jgi:hypothetical protein
VETDRAALGALHAYSNGTPIEISGGGSVSQAVGEQIEFLEAPGTPLALYSRLYLYARTRQIDILRTSSSTAL